MNGAVSVFSRIGIHIVIPTACKSGTHSRVIRFFAREWADQRASSLEGPCAYFSIPAQTSPLITLIQLIPANLFQDRMAQLPSAVQSESFIESVAQALLPVQVHVEPVESL